MKRTLFLSLLAALIAFSLPVSAEDLPSGNVANDEDSSFTGNINLYGGFKLLDHGDWGELDIPQPLGGVEVNFRHESWPVSIDLQYLSSSGLTWPNLITAPFGFISMEYEQTQEFNIGVKKIWEGAPHVRPYIGLGFTYVKAYYENEFNTAWDTQSSFHDSNDGVGGWIDAGVYWELFKHMNLGLGVGYSYSKVVLSKGEDQPREALNPGGFRGGILLGFHM